VGIDEAGAKPLGQTGVVRVALFSETHERLRAWATKDNWRKATEIHKGAYFTRTENLVQEGVLEHIRQHFVDGCKDYVARAPVEAALYRLGDEDVFRQRCRSALVTRLPAVVAGVFDEKREACVVDFANKRLGGGWMSYGMVQEEKMFIERFDYGALCARSLLDMPSPIEEPLASPFSMRQDEAWLLRGGPAFAEVKWYGRTPPDAMDKVVLLDPELDQEAAPTVVAIDAIKASFTKYDLKHLDMMVVKAYTGFVAARHDPDLGGQEQISTGSWGCGAFHNNERVMFVVQALAANAAGVSLVHHTLGDGLSLAPALAFLEECLLRRRSVEESLLALSELCAGDPEWSSKFGKRRAPSRL
jgi:hypothetical protein